MENNEFETMNNKQDTQAAFQPETNNNAAADNLFTDETAPIPEMPKGNEPSPAQTVPQNPYQYFSRPEPPVQQQPAPQYQPENSYFDQINDNYYSNPYSQQPTDETSHHQAKPKKSGKGKKVALVICALVLTLGIGVGGGVLGSYLLNNQQNGVVVESSAQQNSTPAENSKNNESALIIKQASSTDIAPTTTQEVAAKVKDAVVEITTETTTYDSFYGQYVSKAAGSGVIISEDGYLLTNNHVIDGANNITVRLTDSKTYEAKLIGKDATLDVALLKIEATGLTTATFGDSAKLSVGQTAIAIGNPLGQLGGTVTDGIISALDREIIIDGKTMNLLQTNAAINPGNSGGGLFDSQGNLIGIVVAKSSSTSTGTSVEGLGFAIPINDVMGILEDLKTNGHVTDRGYLGVNLVDITTQNAMFMYRVDEPGVYVSYVGKGTPAEKAGLQLYDIIKKIDDKEISQSSEITAIIAKHKKGDTIKITYQRDGKTEEATVTLDARPDEETTQESSQPSRYSDNTDEDELFRRFFGNNW